jgi:hypothetical protein
MKYIRKTAGSTCTDYKAITEIAKELNITSVLDKIHDYLRNWLKHINKTPHARFPRIIKKKLQTKRQKKPGETIKETA